MGAALRPGLKPRRWLHVMGVMIFPFLFAATLASAVPIDTSGFRDGRNHWRNINQPERIMQALPAQPSHGPEQVREIVSNILLFQRANGGWPKDYDMTAVLTDEQKALISGTREREDTSYDNHNTHPQVDYLARAYAQFGEPAWRTSCERGLDFILASQYANGGFPQRWPKPRGFAAHITFNDGVMMGIMNVLKAAADPASHFAWLDETRRDRARRAMARGIECILRCQITVGDTATGWGQQHDEKTFETRPARTFELACIAPQHTTEVLDFLMSLENPSGEVIRAITDGVKWLEQARLTGIRVQRIDAPREEFFRHSTEHDVVVVEDAAAPPIWARHYEAGSNRPIFASRDGIKVYSLAEVDRERRTGSGWYGTWPALLLEQEYPAWRKRNGG
ncbi:MAG: pectate lyase [Opitutus sp.]